MYKKSYIFCFILQLFYLDFLGRVAIPGEDIVRMLAELEMGEETQEMKIALQPKEESNSHAKKGFFSSHVNKVKGYLYLAFQRVKLPLKESFTEVKTELNISSTATMSNELHPYLQVTIVKAEGLKRSDLDFSSDPFVYVKLCDAGGKQIVPADKRQQTVVKKKNLNPIWNHTFHFPLPTAQTAVTVNSFVRESTLTATVYDCDFGGQNDFLGEIVLHGESFFASTGENTAPTGYLLQEKDGKKKSFNGVKGKLYLSIKRVLLPIPNPNPSAAAAGDNTNTHNSKLPGTSQEVQSGHSQHQQQQQQQQQKPPPPPPPKHPNLSPPKPEGYFPIMDFHHLREKLLGTRRLNSRRHAFSQETDHNRRAKSVRSLELEPGNEAENKAEIAPKLAKAEEVKRMKMNDISLTKMVMQMNLLEMKNTIELSGLTCNDCRSKEEVVQRTREALLILRLKENNKEYFRKVNKYTQQQMTNSHANSSDSSSSPNSLRKPISAGSVPLTQTDWHVHTDPVTGKPFWYNVVSGKKVWDRPDRIVPLYQKEKKKKSELSIDLDATARLAEQIRLHKSLSENERQQQQQQQMFGSSTAASLAVPSTQQGSPYKYTGDIQMENLEALYAKGGEDAALKKILHRYQSLEQVKNCNIITNKLFTNHATSPNNKTVKELWRRIDYNGNNLVSKAEIDRFVVELQHSGKYDNFFAGV